MAQTKTPNDVRGVIERCVNYSGCPVCYGCRRYHAADPDCQECMADGAKKNICNTDLHKAHLINKLITKNTVSFPEGTEFKSNL